MATKSVDNQEIVYEEFEPFCKWQRKEDRHVLEINLQDFKKEQLKVQTTNGVLKISGERPIDAKKRARFYKEVDAPNTKYDTHAILAKFINHHLIITLPLPSPPEPFWPSILYRLWKPRSAAAPAPGSSCGGSREKKAPAQCQLQPCRKPPLLMWSKMAANLAVTAVAMVVLAAYAHFMYKSLADRDSS